MKNIVNLIIIVLSAMFACHIVAMAVTAPTFDGAYVILLSLPVFMTVLTVALSNMSLISDAMPVLLFVLATLTETWVTVLILVSDSFFK